LSAGSLGGVEEGAPGPVHREVAEVADLHDQRAVVCSRDAAQVADPAGVGVRVTGQQDARQFGPTTIDRQPAHPSTLAAEAAPRDEGFDRSCGTYVSIA
jgi:hypothetical protein